MVLPQVWQKIVVIHATHFCEYGTAYSMGDKLASPRIATRRQQALGHSPKVAQCRIVVPLALALARPALIS